eukprot:m.532533 g.532533  ORF g.532533 m.532533 type:complete len:72 (-) comp22046_c0_seq4:1902-2117(-)
MIMQHFRDERRTLKVACASSVFAKTDTCSENLVQKQWVCVNTVPIQGSMSKYTTHGEPGLAESSTAIASIA